ncbi:MAG: Bax inhibitor-1/YccA family protein [Saprospiraceae bacterium]
MSHKSFFESKNPLLSESKFIQTASVTTDQNSFIISDKATISGAINKSFILFSVLLFTSAISFVMPSTFLMICGVVGGLIAVLVASFKPHTSPISAPVYAGFEGLFVGSISAIFASMIDGIILQAVGLTFGTLLTMLVIYKSNIIPVTEKLKSGIMMATGAVFFVYLISFIGSFFGFNIPYLHEGGVIGIGISVVIIGIASLNLLLDFDQFEKAEQHGAPKYMEWFCALGLMVTLVWLYIEFLRLLSKLNRE